MDFLFRLATSNIRFRPSGRNCGLPNSDCTPREKSPCPGVSTLITSAPRSASTIDAVGPWTQIVKSMTRIPCSGIRFACSIASSIVVTRRLIRFPFPAKNGKYPILDVDNINSASIPQGGLPMAREPRRIVTGNDAEGKSVIVINGPPTPFAAYWLTDSTPVDNSKSGDAGQQVRTLEPPPGGSIFRFASIPPEDPKVSREEVERRTARMFAQMD